MRASAGPTEIEPDQQQEGCSVSESQPQIKNPPAGFREGFQLVRLVMRELRWPLESPWGP